MKRFLIVLAVLFSAVQVHAASGEHKLLRRLVVFPLQVSKQDSKAADEVWWKLRETLTDDKRFLVAQKNFMVKKDVFQPRSALSAADSIILGQLLDAQGLVVTYIEERQLKMAVYDGEDGSLFWDQTLQLHPSLPIDKQLMQATMKLIKDFTSSVPYQGFVFTDQLIGQSVYRKNQKILTKVDVGLQSKAQAGDKVQFIRVYRDKVKPLFTEGARIEIFAEGVVDSVSREGLEVQLLRVTKLDDIINETMVRLPQEFNRMRDQFSLQNQMKLKSLPDSSATGMQSVVNQEIQERKPLIASITFLSNLAAFLFLAF